MRGSFQYLRLYCAVAWCDGFDGVRDFLQELPFGKTVQIKDDAIVGENLQLAGREDDGEKMGGFGGVRSGGLEGGLCAGGGSRAVMSVRNIEQRDGG